MGNRKINKARNVSEADIKAEEKERQMTSKIKEMKMGQRKKRKSRQPNAGREGCKGMEEDGEEKKKESEVNKKLGQERSGLHHPSPGRLMY